MKTGVQYRLMLFILAAALLLSAVGCTKSPVPGSSSDISSDTASCTHSDTTSVPGEDPSEASLPENSGTSSQPLSPYDGSYMIPLTKNGKYVLFGGGTTLAEKNGVTLKHVKMKIKGYDYDDPFYKELFEPEFVGALMLYDSQHPDGRLLELLGRNASVKTVGKHGDFLYLWLSRWWAFSEGCPTIIERVDLANESVYDLTQTAVPSCLLIDDLLYMLDYQGRMMRASLAGGNAEHIATLPKIFSEMDVMLNEHKGDTLTCTLPYLDSKDSEKVNLRFNLTANTFEYDADPHDYLI